MAANSKSTNARIPGFFKLSIEERIHALHKHGLLTDEDVRALKSGSHTLRPLAANHMIENVIGVLGLPLGMGLNFLINGRDYVVPLAVEEPSIVAGLSGAARTVRQSGGFSVQATDPILIGQIQVANVLNLDCGREAVYSNKEDIINLANSIHPKMLARGGGCQDVEVHIYEASDQRKSMLVVHLLVDTRDAMGANVVNGMCESVASLIEAVTGGKVFLRILSNLTDRSIVKGECTVPIDLLQAEGFSGEAIRDGIVLANDLALVDPYRAVTHNKGIMNGVDAVALATGNDFRALEAAAHAYAARDGTYRALTKWSISDAGALHGEINMPMKVGIVGGSLETNPTVRISHRILGCKTATELAGVMGVVGLAQNYAALRSLSTAGIQQHHMTLHARSVASAAKVPHEYFDEVVDALIESGEIKVWKANEILQHVKSPPQIQSTAKERRSSAGGKAIVMGEHAVVYGQPAFAIPIPLTIEARVVDAKDKTLVIPRWGLEQSIHDVAEQPQGLVGTLSTLLKNLELESKNMTIEVFPNVPKAMGLGGSAAMSVAIIRALSDHYRLNLDDEAVNRAAFECERAAHGNPSGIDNTIATYGKPLVYQRVDDSPQGVIQFLSAKVPVPFVLGMTRKESLTAAMIERVRSNRERQPDHYDSIFRQLGHMTHHAVDSFQAGDFSTLGDLMNIAHGLLYALQLSTPELEELAEIARSHGALGAKLTGGGGGGSIIALCPETQDEVVRSIETAGYQAMAFEIS